MLGLPAGGRVAAGHHGVDSETVRPTVPPKPASPFVMTCPTPPRSCGLERYEPDTVRSRARCHWMEPGHQPPPYVRRNRSVQIAWAALEQVRSDGVEIDAGDRARDRHGSDGSTGAPQGRGHTGQALVGLLVVEGQARRRDAVELEPQLPGEVMVRGVRRGRSCSRTSSAASASKASMALPRPVQYAGWRPPWRVGSPKSDIGIRSRYNTSAPSRIASCTASPVVTDRACRCGKADVRQPAVPRRQTADLEQAHADAVPGHLSFQPSDAAELLDHPVDGGLRQPGAVGQLVQGERSVGIVEGAHDAVDPTQHRPTGAVAPLQRRVRRIGDGVERSQDLR